MDPSNDMERRFELQVTAIRGLPLFARGMDIVGEILAAAAAQGERLGRGDVLVVAQKIVSKAEGREVRLADVVPGDEAEALAAKTGREAALAQLILDESQQVMRAHPAAVIVRHHSGHVLANAGIDASNVGGGGEATVLLWPINPDASARALRAKLALGLGAMAGDVSAVIPAVIIADSMGRAWRIGTVGTAIGCAGLSPLDDQRGQVDLFGRTLQATVIAVADTLAGMAVLAMGEGAEGTPAAIIRGCERWVSVEDGPGAASSLRPIEQDMFR